MKSRQHFIEDNEDPPASGWLCTFNDMMTLLLVFFVLLFSMGTVDGPMMQNFQKALQSGLGVLGKGSQIAAEDTREKPSHRAKSMIHQPAPALDSDEPSLKEWATQMADRINHKAGKPIIQIGEQGQIRMDNQVLFSLGDADLNPNGLPLLKNLSDAFRNTPYGIRVEGHTDNIAIQTAQFPSNWELSIARAVNVVKYLARHGRIAPQRLSAAGYADAKPVLPNTSHANRALNRRVEIVLLKGKTK